MRLVYVRVPSFPPNFKASSFFLLFGNLTNIQIGVNTFSHFLPISEFLNKCAACSCVYSTKNLHLISAPFQALPVKQQQMHSAVMSILLKKDINKDNSFILTKRVQVIFSMLLFSGNMSLCKEEEYVCLN